MVFHRLFEAQVEKTPDSLAAGYQDQNMNYRELNARANRLGRFLVQQGLEKEAVVGLMADRSIDFLTAMIGTFKVGGVYLPVDPRYPSKRTQQITKQSQAFMLLVEAEYEARVREAMAEVPADERPQIHVLEEVLADESLDDSNIDTVVNPEDLAYVIFTSGSTGTPKGAMVEHRGMVNHLYCQSLRPRIDGCRYCCPKCSAKF